MKKPNKVRTSVSNRALTNRGKSSASFGANVGLLGQVQEQAGRIKRNMSATGTLTSLLCLPLLFAFSLASGEKKKAPCGSGVRQRKLELAKLEGDVNVKVKVVGHLSFCLC